MVKQKQVRFECDSCGKLSDFNEEDETLKNHPYPYTQGWIYIYLMKIKYHRIPIEMQDKHFCSKKCFGSYFKKILDEKTKEAMLKKL